MWRRPARQIEPHCISLSVFGLTNETSTNDAIHPPVQLHAHVKCAVMDLTAFDDVLVRVLAWSVSLARFFFFPRSVGPESEKRFALVRVPPSVASIEEQRQGEERVFVAQDRLRITVRHEEVGVVRTGPLEWKGGGWPLADSVVRDQCAAA
jgi:hypothetical protein